MGENAPKFKSSFFGYSKKDVNSYIVDLIAKTDKEIMAKENELKVINENLNQISEENRSLKARVRELEQEKHYISNAIIKAEQEAAKILENAAIEAEKKKQQLLSEIENEEKRLLALQEEFAKRKEELLKQLTQSADSVRNLSNSLMNEFEQLIQSAEERIKNIN